MEGHSLAERLVRQLSKIINNDRNIKDFDVIPVEVNHSNKSPILYEGFHLGVESWCVKYILDYAYNALMDVHFAKCQSNRSARNNYDRMDELLIAVLLFHPDVTTFWNKRRELVAGEFLTAESELRFTRLVLSYKPKSNEVFAYRKWLLIRTFSDTSATFVYLMRDLIAEFALTTACADKCPNNYHAWSHRVWLMKLLVEHSRFKMQRSMRGRYVTELLRSEPWTCRHVSDYSGLHYRQFCITNVLNMRDCFEFMHLSRQKVEMSLYEFVMRNLDQCLMPPRAIGKDNSSAVKMLLGQPTLVYPLSPEKRVHTYQNACILVYELRMNEYASKMFVSYETLWCHRRFVTHHLMELMYEYFNEPKPQAGRLSAPPSERTPAGNLVRSFEGSVSAADENAVKEPKISRQEHYLTYNCPLYKALAVNERRLIDQRTEAGDRNAKKYEVWLKVMLNFPF